MPDTLAAGTYNLLARVDATNVIVEGTVGEANNLTVGPQFQVTWQFGAVPGRTGNTTLTLRDADGTRVTFSLNGPGLGEVIRDGANWDVRVTGTTASSAVNILTNNGGNNRVTVNDIHVLGPLATFTAETTDLTGTLAIDGPVTIPGLPPGTITLGSIQGGTVAVPSVEALTILGSVTNAKIYVGTTLGQDGQPGGTGANADTYGAGKIGLFTVTGSMAGTTVRVGIDPMDGIYGNGNDILIGGSASSIGGIIIGGGLSADTRFIAGAFPAKYLVGVNLRPTVGDPHFISNFSGPSLSAALQQDTGTSSNDRLTNTPNIVGNLTDPDGIATFVAGFGAVPTFDVFADRQPDGSFTLTQARLEQIYGGLLTDGTYVLKLQATDSNGNPAQTTFSFTLDTAAPMVTFDLTPGSDTPPIGDQQTTNAIVTLVGQTEASALVELLGLGLTTTADGTGTFSFSTVALTLGANLFTVRATDTAGNQRSETRTITRVVIGNATPVLDAIGNQTIDEGSPLSFTATATDADLPANTLTFSLENGASGLVPTGASITAGGVFTWTPTEVQGPGTFTFDVVVSDGTATDSETLTVTVNEVNQAPAGTDKTITINEDTPYTFTLADFGFIDLLDSPANSLLAVRIMTTPGTGTLTLNGLAVTALQTMAVANIDNLVFTPAANGNGTAYAYFTFQVQDNGGTAHTGVDLDPTPNTITFNVMADSDGDGIPDSQETGGPNGGDANSDGISDSQQSNVVSVLNSANQYVTLVAPAGATITGAHTLGNPSPGNAPADITFPLGFVEFQLTGLIGGAATVDLLLPAGVTANTYWQYGATPDNAASHWYEFLYDGTTGAEINGSVITVHLQDGARGDHDLTVNGTIVDPSAAAFVKNHAPAGADKTITIYEDTPYRFTAADFGFTDPSDSPASHFQAVTITTLPDAGTLTLNGAPVNVGDAMTIPQPGEIWTARASTQNWQSVASSADGTKLVASVYGGFLYTSTDAGETWTARESIRDWSGVASSADGRRLVAGVAGGQLYTSTNSGEDWTARASIQYWVSVASSADGLMLVAAASNPLGTQQLFTSTNAGLDWTGHITPQLWTDVASSADGRNLIAASFGHLYTSTNAGGAWTARASIQNWVSVASSADGTKLVAATDNHLYTSTNAGVTWTARENSRNWTDVASSADGMMLVATVRNGQLYTSIDAGVTWTARASTQKWWSVASSADGGKLVAGVLGGQLFTSVIASLGPLVFTPAVNANGSSYTSFTFQVQDDGGMLNSGVDLDPSANRITINVTPVNDAPVNVVPGAQTTLEDRVFVFNAANGNPISITDVDSSTVTATLAVTHGALTLGGTTGLTGLTGNGMGAVSFGGTIADINAALAGLSYLPTLNFNGNDTLWLTTTDGVAAPVFSWVSLTVMPVNDAPVTVVVPGAQTTVEDQALLFTTANGNLISVSDVTTVTVTITLAVTHGALTLGGTTGLTGLTGNSTGLVRFGGSLTDINTALTGLSYLPTLNYNGSDTLTLTAANGVTTPVLLTVALMVTPVNDAPAGTDQTITTLGDTAYTFTLEDFGFTDPLDSPANHFKAVTITTLPVAGTLTLNGAPVNMGDAITIIPAGVTWTARESNRGWVSIASSADGTKLVAGTTGGQLYTSTDSGITWTARESHPGSVYGVASSADGMKLVAARYGGGLYTSTDAGETWTERGSGGAWWSVASSADGMKLVAVEYTGRLWTSTNAGVSWTPHLSARQWLSVASSADGMQLVAAHWGGQLYTSTDAGETWTVRESARQWASVASSADGTKLVAGVGIGGSGQLYTSTDSGATWTARGETQGWASVASSADGMQLVAAAYGNQLYTSMDAGVTWTARESNRQWYAVASSADGNRLVAADSGTGPGGHLYTSVASLGLVFTPAFNANGSPYTSFTFQVQDDGGTLNGGVDLDPSANRITININYAPVNGVPSAQTTLEDAGLLFTTANGNLISVNDVDSTTMTVTLAVTHGALTLGGTTGLTGLTGNGTGAVSFGGTIADINAALTGLSYLPTLNFNGSDTLWLTTADGVAALVHSTIALTVMSVNDAPAGVDQTITTPGDIAYTFAPEDFGFTDPLDSPADGFQAVKITTLPAAGTLTFDGTPVSAGDFVSLSPGLAGATWTARASSQSWSAVASSADGMQLVGASGEGLYTSTDAGATWMARRSGAWSSVASSADGAKLVAGTYDGQLYTSTDSGITWTARESHPGSVYGVASSADGMKLVAARYGGGLYTSTDAGVTWTTRVSTGVLTWWSVASSADGMTLAAVEYGGRLWTSTDAGVSWTPHLSARQWLSVASSADGTKLVAAHWGGQLYTSTDSGETWTARESARQWASVASSADGTKLVAGVGVGGVGQLYTSTDSGATWTARASSQSWSAVATSADGTKLVAAASGGRLYTSVASPGLVFTPTFNANGSPYTSFTFQVKDDGDTLNGGTNLDPLANTITINVTA